MQFYDEILLGTVRSVREWRTMKTFSKLEELCAYREKELEHSGYVAMFLACRMYS